MDTELEPVYTKHLSYETTLNNLKYRMNDIWQEDPEDYDVLIPVLCNICLTNELLQERFSTVTASDVLAGISFTTHKDKSNNGINEHPERQDDDDDNFFGSEVFKLKEECSVESCETNDQDTDNEDSAYWSDVRTVGFGRNEEHTYVCYNEPFDPRLSFAGLHDVVFPDSESTTPNIEQQDNVCLAIDDFDDLIPQYINKYHDYLNVLQAAQPGDWVNKLNSTIPSKFTSYEQWLTDKNTIDVENETDPDCHLLASKLTSGHVRRLWRDESTCSVSTTDDQDVFSQHGSGCGQYNSTSESLTLALSETEGSHGCSSFSHYQEFPDNEDSSGQEEPISPLWSGRDVSSFKDFVPRMSYGFNLPVPDVVTEDEEPSVPGDVSWTGYEEETVENTTGSKFFNIWCVPDQDDGQGDGTNKYSEWSKPSAESGEWPSPPDIKHQNGTWDSPPSLDYEAQLTTPEIGLQIPRLVSSKRRERPVKGIKFTRRLNVKEYQVSCLDGDNKTESSFSTPEATSAISDTTIWNVKGDFDGMHVANDKQGFSRSETHQEFRHSRTQANQPVDATVELSADSEPFFPKRTFQHEYDYYGVDAHGRESLYHVDEEPAAEMCSSPSEEREVKTNLSPVSQPFVPRNVQNLQKQQHQLCRRDDQPQNIRQHSQSCHHEDPLQNILHSELFYRKDPQHRNQEQSQLCHHEDSLLNIQQQLQHQKLQGQQLEHELQKRRDQQQQQQQQQQQTQQQQETLQKLSEQHQNLQRLNAPQHQQDACEGEDLPLHRPQPDDEDQHSYTDNLQRQTFFTDQRKTSMLESYLKRQAPKGTSNQNDVQEYKLFEETNTTFYDNPFLETDLIESTSVQSSNKQRGQIGNMKFTASGWQKITVGEKNSLSSLTQSCHDVHSSADLLPTTPVQNVYPAQHQVMRVSNAHASGTAQSLWSVSDVCLQPQPTLVPHVQQQPSNHSLASLVTTQFTPTSVARVVRPQGTGVQQVELNHGVDTAVHGAVPESRLRQVLTPHWTSSERSMISSLQQGQENPRIIQTLSPMRPIPNVSIVHSQLACVPKQTYTSPYRKMVMLQPHHKPPDSRPTIRTLLPHVLAPALKPAAYQTLRPTLTPTIQRLPFEPTGRLQPSVISCINTAFAPHIGFTSAVPTQAYRHVAVSANYGSQKLVVVPKFKAPPQARFYASYLNFNNHNDAAYSSDSEMSESSADTAGMRDDDTEQECDRYVRARPIRANPANLIHLA